ncbi:site-specific DNA-methyltransferase [Ornithinimicrobium sp. Y1694]|uniref:site-specific DNA-methyltransferase n=1 Tax=Ornithinimicrobium sp. Y1694 TaxID=3418590 RepID=UPI003CF3882B
MDEYVEGVQAPKVEGVVYTERADLEPTTDNLLILGESGDVLEALTRVPELREKYVGKVKCIYIDPPFNTGAIFGDSYEDNLEHSVWLTLMRDRLGHLQRLLSKEGTIWVHLDDSEVHRMRVLLDETFGPGRFLGSVIWQKADGPRNDLPNFSVDHDTILVYGATDAAKLHQQGRDESLNVIYTSVDGDERAWYDDNPTAPSAHRNQTWVYAIQNPLTGELMYPADGRCWGAKQETVFAALSEYARFRLEVIDDDERRARVCGVPVEDVRKGIPAILLDESMEDAAVHVADRKRQGIWPEFILRAKGTLGRKRIQPEGGTNVRTLWLNTEVGHNRQAKSEIKNLFPGESPFATPKPEALVARIILAATEPGDIVLDCFAGSGTTPAVAQKLGRRWLACELKRENFERYTLPRMQKVVSGSDQGGVSVTQRKTDERTLSEGFLLPEGISTVAEAWAIDRAFDKAARNLQAEVDISKMIQAAVRRDKKSAAPALTDAEGKQLLSLLKRLPSDEVDEVDLLPHVKRSVLKQIKTERLPDEVHWRGGGGFQVSHLPEFRS